MIMRGPMMCCSFEDIADLITRTQHAKYYASMRQYYNHVLQFKSVPRVGPPAAFERFSAFDLPSGWCGHGRRPLRH